MTPNPILFAILLGIALLIFTVSLWRRFSLVALGKPENRLDQIGMRVWDMLLYAFGQKRVVAKPFGINHFIIFWSFMILLLANTTFILEGLFPHFKLEAILPEQLFHGLMFLFDLASLLALTGVIIAVGRRLLVRPTYLDTPYVKGISLEAFFILSCIGLLMIAYFVLNGALIAVLGSSAPFMPLSSVVAAALAASPLANQLFLLATVAWWVHAGVLLAFICYLPMSKHMHIITAIPNCFLQNLTHPPLPKREEFVSGNCYGAEKATDFTWKDLLDGFACTECGRCQSACPAQATEKPLNPRQIVHALKTNLLANAAALKAGQKPTVPLIGSEGEGTITDAAIWACTTCGACVEACPVMIEQYPKIIQLRRHLVEMQASFPEELLNFFENIEGRSNPWGIAPTERTKWASTMEVKTFEAGKTEYLLYVGCAGAFDSRTKHVTVALATILDAAGISWGILGKEEKCCGDSLRRLGNEYVFEKIATENAAMFRDKGITKVITQCPHCFSTLKNDYRQYGVELQVIHHTEFIQELLTTGKLKLPHQVDLGTMLFHDSCYLGRHNNIYDAPRQIISTATGTSPKEFDRTGSNGFCCGGGGGRMWLEEHEGSRININRVEEALAKNPDTVCVACPYCLTMFEDGFKDKQAGQTRVRDIAEVVAEGLRLV